MSSIRILASYMVAVAMLIAACSPDSENRKAENDGMAATDSASAYFIRSWSGFAEVNGAEMYYETAGEGTPLVMLHAGIADGRMWRKQAEFFTRFYKVVTCDLRGFGKTGMPEGPYAHYRDLAGLLDTLGIDTAILMGCSLGGSVAIDFALEYPGRVRGLVLVSSALDGYRFEDKKTKEGWMEIDKAVRKKRYEKAADLEIAQWVVGSGRSPDKINQSINDLVREMLLTYYRNDPGKGEEQGLEEPAIDRLEQIAAPTLIVVGDRDAGDILDISDILDSRIPNSRKVTITETAHLPNLEKPDGFNVLVHDFLREAGL